MRLFKQLDRLLEVSSFEARSRIKIICVEESGIQFDSPLKFGGGIFELSLNGECLADGNMCFGQIRIELQRMGACALPASSVLGNSARTASPMNLTIRPS